MEIQNHAPPIGSTSHEGGSHRSDVDADVSDAGIGIVVLSFCVHESHHLAGFYNREHFADGLYDRSSSDGAPGRSMAREMNCYPGAQLTIVWQGRKGFERQFFQIDRVPYRKPMFGRHDQFSLILKQHRALDEAVVGERKSAECSIDFARCNRFKLVQQGELHPVNVDLKFVPEMPDKWQR